MNRRDFLGSVACAFAVAGVGSRIPAGVFVQKPGENISTWEDFCTSTMRAKMTERWAYVYEWGSEARIEFWPPLLTPPASVDMTTTG